jgi:hypothetical protein
LSSKKDKDSDRPRRQAEAQFLTLVFTQGLSFVSLKSYDREETLRTVTVVKVVAKSQGPDKCSLSGGESIHGPDALITPQVKSTSQGYKVFEF